MVATIVFMVIGFLGTVIGSILVALAKLGSVGFVMAIAFAILMVAMMVLLPIGRIHAKRHTREMRYMYDNLVHNKTRTEVIKYNKEICRLKAKATCPCWTFYNKYWLNRFETINLFNTCTSENSDSD